MPLTLAKMASNEASVTVTDDKLGDESINLVYYPNRITSAEIKQIDGDFDTCIQALAKAIKSWDLLQDDEISPLPVDVESLSYLGASIVWAIRSAIVKDIRPN